MKRTKNKSTNKHTKRQIVVIHGGTTFDSQKEYIHYISTRSVSAENFKLRRDWKDALGRTLGDEYELFIPKMPNGTSAHYAEWKIWFERMLPFLKNGVVLVGHSLGGIFLAKYFAENNVKTKIGALILVAAPFDADDSDESLGDFTLPPTLTRLARQVKNIYLVYSVDDPVVSFTQAHKYQDVLPGAAIMRFSDRGHFNQEKFPELVKLLRSFFA